MHRRHKERVRAYLLGLLDETEAAQIEERYFADNAYFQWVRDVETELIGQYLAGRLKRPDRNRFESRYLTVPEMRKRLEEVRAAGPVAPRQSFRLRWYAAAAGVALVISVPSVWLYWQGHGATPPHTPNPAPPRPPLILAVHLSPGVSKGASAGMEFVQPAGGRVRLSLELPGRTTPVDCRVDVALVAPGGEHETVWTSPAALSHAAGSGSSVEVELEAAALRPGDYVVTVSDPQRATLETYVFRVTPPH